MNDYTALPCSNCVAAFVRALYPDATMFSIDPEDDDVAARPRLLPLRNENDYFVYVPDVDYIAYFPCYGYFLYDPKISASTTLTPE